MLSTNGVKYKPALHPKKPALHPKKPATKHKNMRKNAPLQPPKILKTFKSIKNIEKRNAKNFVLM